MENLEDVLNRESTEYENLLGVSMKKTSVIVKGDLEALQAITDEEQLAASRISRIDKEREKIMTDVAGVLNTDVNTLKLKDLLQILERRPAERQKLAAAYDRLSRSVHAMKRVNEQNRELITNALEMTQFELNMLQAMKSAPETANYDRSACNDGSVMGTAQVKFDAKQ